MSAVLEIQKAVFDALASDAALSALLGGQRILDDVPDRMAPPYVLFGTAESLDWSTATEGGEEHFLELEIWSDRNGRKQAVQIAGEVRRVLDQLGETAPVVMSGHHLISVSSESLLTTREDKNRYFLANLTVRLVSEPVVA